MKYVTLEEVCENRTSNISQKDLKGNEGIYPIYGASGLIKKVDFYIQDKEYIGIVKDGAGVGRTMLLPSKSSVIGTMQYIIPKGSLNIKYLYYALISKKLSKYSSGATIPHIYFRDYKKEKIVLISEIEQQKIVSILDKIVSLIEKNKKRIILLEELVKSRFIEMFGDTIKNDKGWEVKKWEEVLKIINGKNQKKVENESGKYDIFGSGGKMGKADDWLVKENSVLIGRKGSINKPIIVKEKIWNVDTVFGLEPNIEIINCDYLYYFCYFYDFERLNKAVTIPSLTKKDLLKIDIPIPPLVLQEKFVLIHKSINKLKFEAEKSLKEMENLYDSLMQKFFKQ